MPSRGACLFEKILIFSLSGICAGHIDRNHKVNSLPFVITAMMNSPSRQFVGSARSGFSLVEVVLAVGVVAFAFVAIMGLIPAGIHQFRQAIDNSVCTQIGQRVLQDCEQTDFNTLVDYAHTYPPIAGQPTYFRAPSLLATQSAGGVNQGACMRYFDEEGNEIVPETATANGIGYGPSANESLRIVYWVNTRIAASTLLPTGTNTNPSSEVASVVVQVIYNPAQMQLQTYPAMGGGLTSQAYLVMPTQTPSGGQTVNLQIRTYSAQFGRNF
jgi:type II secretory pathway pseudopilin PulG